MRKYTLPALFVVFTVVTLFCFYYRSSNSGNLVPSADPEIKRTDYLESFFRNTVDYEESFNKAACTNKESILAGVVSHHYLARDLIAEFFACIDTTGVETVLVVGPDHFNALNNLDILAVTSALDWKTPFGILESDKEEISKLQSDPGIHREDNVFRIDHSVYTLIPFIKKTFTDAEVVPLVLKGSKDYEKYYELGKHLSIKNSVLIVSSDFSHDVTEIKALQQDQSSIYALRSMNKVDLSAIESDCVHCMSLLYGYLEGIESEFILQANKNSQDFGGSDTSSVTSYVSGYYLLK